MAIGTLGQHGREVIYSAVEEITEQNVAQVVSEALPIHARNQSAIQYLWNYYKGVQPILDKVSETRPEINHQAVENHAHEIITFKTGYLMGEPVQYVKNSSTQGENEDIMKLNDYAFVEDRAEKDKQLADWFYICGTGYKMILPNKEASEDDSPFHIYILDPRDTFVVYSSGYERKPLLGVYMTADLEGNIIFTCYSKNHTYKLSCGGSAIGGMLLSPIVSNQPLANSANTSLISSDLTIAEVTPHILGDVPIIEYPANMGRLGAFEIVLPLLDEINNVLSRRSDSLDRFVEAFMVITGFKLETDNDGNPVDNPFSHLREYGGIALPEGADIKYMLQELKQDQVQTLADSLYQTVLEICGMPNRQNGVRSSSDNGIAVMYRDGWSTAETHAQCNEGMFKLSERQFLRIALRIADRRLNLRVQDIKIKFSRRNYDNVLQKVQALTMMLSNDKIAERIAYVYCGLFVDPDAVYEESLAYQKSREAEIEAEMQREIEQATLQSKALVNANGTEN